MKTPLALLVLLCCCHFAWAQRTITGVVSDQNGEAIIGATVQTSTAVGTLTDLDGRYSINLPKGATTLIFSYIGYTTQERPVGAASVLDVTLVEG
ncbi:MAG: carboxypeptidase-like regulatory domain-containing protein, partial [Bacteroidota bacterium]